eukprot:4863105-Amphidinium_carterae.1
MRGGSVKQQLCACSVSLRMSSLKRSSTARLVVPSSAVSMWPHLAYPSLERKPMTQLLRLPRELTAYHLQTCWRRCALTAVKVKALPNACNLTWGRYEQSLKSRATGRMELSVACEFHLHPTFNIVQLCTCDEDSLSGWRTVAGSSQDEFGIVLVHGCCNWLLSCIEQDSDCREQHTPLSITPKLGPPEQKYQKNR